MGQYYVPVVLNEAGQIEHRMCSWDFDNGAKLMEHSWIGNDFVAAFETLLLAEAPRRVVWAGDYADPEIDAEGRPVMRTYERGGELVTREANLHSLAQDVEPYRPAVKGLGERAQLIGGVVVEGVRDPRVVPNAFPRMAPGVEAFPYLVNWDKRVYVDKSKVPAVRYYWSGADELAIHPLPLLTVEGNGRGAGDFEPTGLGGSAATGNDALVGAWARDHIALAARVPDGFAEVIFDLIESGAEEQPPADQRVSARRDSAA